MQTIEERIAAVEDRQMALGRSLRRWRVGCAGLAAGLLVTIGVAATPGGNGDVPELVKAKGVEIVDAAGKPTITIGSVPEVMGAIDGIQFWDANGIRKVNLRVRESGGSLSLVGDDDKGQRQFINLDSGKASGKATPPRIEIYQLGTVKLWSAP